MSDEQTKIDDGGPAFPCGLAATASPNGDPILYDSADRAGGGMSLRDYFAGQALAGLAPQDSSWARIAKGCYIAADAMLAARKAVP